MSASPYDWRARREKRAFLALEDGTILRGYPVGALSDTVGEVVFNTGMTGYQEILSDPSYAGQFVTMTGDTLIEGAGARVTRAIQGPGR